MEATTEIFWQRLTIPSMASDFHIMFHVVGTGPGLSWPKA
jgi:hypothetical protein